MTPLDNTSKSRPGSGGVKNRHRLESLRKGHVRRCVPSPNRRAPPEISKGNLSRLPLALLELLL